MTDPTDQPTGPMETPERFADDARRYRLDSRIATGGMGEVWRSSDMTLGRTVAVKVLKAEYADDPTFRGRFETEARNAAALHHPNVAGIFDFGQASPVDGSASPRPYLVMELVEGQPLSALLRPDQPMEPAVAVDLMTQAAEAIGAAHRAGIVHRDVKPANLLVTRERTLKITDFGIARAADGVALTQTGMVMGTPQYISPEQAQGLAAGPESDVYSLGVVAFECLAGRRPFVAETAVATALAHLRDPVPDLPGTVPPALAAVVRRALAKKPEERFSDGTAFARALRDPSRVGAAPVAAAATPADDAGTQVMTTVGRPTPVAPPPVVPVPVPDDEPDEREPARRSPLPWIAGVLALLLVAALIWLFVAMNGDEEQDPADTPTTSATSALTTEETTPAETSEPPSEEPTTEETSEEPTPDTFSIQEGDYLGQPIDAVESQLRQLGLAPDLVEETNDGSETEGRVTSVSPTSDLLEGDSVTVTYAGPAPEEEPEPTEEPTENPGNGNGNGNGTPGGPGGSPTQTQAP